MAQDYTCSMCGATFGSQAELDRHNQEQHAEEMKATEGEGKEEA